MSWFSRLGAMWRYTLVGLFAIAVIAGATLTWFVFGPGPTDFAGSDQVSLADYHGPNPTGVPAELAHAGIIQRGEYLARAADCAACHTPKGGAPFSGGLAFVLPFGTIFSANITSDRATGIGSWSDADFLNAIHRGRDDEGEALYPVMPFTSYTSITDADALAIKAYLFSLAPVHKQVPENRLSFPFNQRWLMGIWAYLFNPDKRFEPHSDRSPQWNRGAYLAESLAHCGECHTPRNVALALDNRSKFAGEIQAGWRAYNITSDRDTGLGGWSDGDLAEYLSTSHADGRGTAAGPMAEAVDESFRHMTRSDIAAIVAYLKTIPAIESRDLPVPKESPAPVSHKQGVMTNYDPLGKQIFEGSCASCHDWTGVSPLTQYATLTGARAVNDPSATNVAQIVLSGIVRNTPTGKIFMPSFGHALSDIEIAAVANYVTARFGAKASNVSAKDLSAMRHGS